MLLIQPVQGITTQNTAQHEGICVWSRVPIPKGSSGEGAMWTGEGFGIAAIQSCGIAQGRDGDVVVESHGEFMLLLSALFAVPQHTPSDINSECKTAL